MPVDYESISGISSTSKESILMLSNIIEWRLIRYRTLIRKLGTCSLCIIPPSGKLVCWNFNSCLFPVFCDSSLICWSLTAVCFYIDSFIFVCWWFIYIQIHSFLSADVNVAILRILVLRLFMMNEIKLNRRTKIYLICVILHLESKS